MAPLQNGRVNIRRWRVLHVSARFSLNMPTMHSCDIVIIPTALRVATFPPHVRESRPLSISRQAKPCWMDPDTQSLHSVAKYV